MVVATGKEYLYILLGLGTVVCVSAAIGLSLAEDEGGSSGSESTCTNPAYGSVYVSVSNRGLAYIYIDGVYVAQNRYSSSISTGQHSLYVELESGSVLANKGFTVYSCRYQQFQWS